MKPLPLPLRVAAGLAASAVERARDLPSRIAGLPVTVASQALQVSMRVQQHVTELAIKGDEALAGLRPVEETPEWATFDEDVDGDRYDVSRPARFDTVEPDEPDLSDEADPSAEPDVEVPEARNGHHPGDDPWTQERRAMAEATGERAEHPAGLDNYDELSLPQLRARLRTFSVEQLEELLAHERAGADRPSFTGMLARRIATVRDQR